MTDVINIEDNPSPEYLKGFNYGYMVAEYIPDLAKQLSTATGTSDRFVGMKHGIEQFEQKKTKTKQPDWLSKNRLQNLDTKEIDKGKEDLDKD